MCFFVTTWGEKVYGLAAAVFTQNINRALETAHKLQAGTVWVSLIISMAEEV